MKTRPILLVLFTCLLLSACELIEIAAPDGSVYFWITTDADTYVECSFAGGGCNGADFDHSGYDFVTVANSALSIKRSYVNFPKITLPAGTVIEEAYFEMYHSGKNEDGKSDEIQLDVNRVYTPWNAGSISYTNQPIQPGNGGAFQMKLKSQDWSGTSNIATLMQEAIPANQFEGFLVSLQSPNPGYEKGFYSGNHRSRTLSDLGLAPRLLMKVNLPDGSDASDVVIGPGHGDGSGGNYVGFRFRSGTNWPSDWNVAHQ